MGDLFQLISPEDLVVFGLLVGRVVGLNKVENLLGLVIADLLLSSILMGLL